MKTTTVHKYCGVYCYGLKKFFRVEFFLLLTSYFLLLTSYFLLLTPHFLLLTPTLGGQDLLLTIYIIVWLGHTCIHLIQKVSKVSVLYSIEEDATCRRFTTGFT